MATPSFSPKAYANVSGTPTTTLAVSLYILHTTYFDPIKKSDQPLPPHVWGLYHTASKKFLSVGQCTDKTTGVCTIMKPQTLTAGSYSLQVFPLADANQQPYVTNKEAWIDLDTGDWLDPALIPVAGTAALLKNKILRIPVWTTDLKAKSGGGFKDAPPKSKDAFGKNGLLKSTDIEPYGTAAAPWEMPLDFGWIRSHVSYLFINWNTAKEETLPPGPLVEVKDATGKRLGAGGAVDPDDGTAYVLVATTPDKWKGLHVGFTVPVGARIDVSAASKPSPDTRLTADGAVPDDRNTRVTLPKAWHSLGQNAFYAPTPGGAATAPKTWDDLRKDLAGDASATEPVLTFHLNDVALVRAGKLVNVPKDSRLTLFDHLLTIQNPDAQAPHLTTGKFSSPLFPAKTVYAVDPSPAPSDPTVNRDLGTRLINLQGTFFDLEETFVSGTPGTTKLLGARAAVAGAHPIAPYTSGCKYIDNEGRYELHLVPVPFVKDPGTKLLLFHGLVYVGSKVTGQSTVGGGGKAYSGNVVSNFYTLLTQAAVRWSQGHPGVANAGLTQKDYRITSDDPADPNIIRLRFFFNERSDNKHTFAIALTVDTSATDDNRSFVQGSQMTYYDSAVNGDATPGANVNDLDSAPAYWHTLAHEFGHVLGLPDEYYEQVDPPDATVTLSAPFMPTYSQYDGWKSGARPYWQDNKAIMRVNKLLRLRHVWHHVRAFNDDAAFKSSLKARPYCVSNTPYPGGGLRYSTPAGKPGKGGTAPPPNLNNPYTPLFRGKMPLADLILFPVGEDEGTVEAMFSPGGAPVARAAGTRFDAILVVRTYYRFIFPTAMTTLVRWNCMNTFHGGYYNQNYDEALRFQLTGGTVLQTIAIAFAPHYAAGGGGPPAHIRINVKGAAAVDAAKNPLLKDNPGATLGLGLPDIAPIPLLRLVLGGQSWVAGTPRTVDATPITVADLAKLAAAVDTMIGDAAGTRTATPI